MRSTMLKRTLGALLALALLVGLMLGAFRLATTYVPEYRLQLQSWLNERTGLVVEFRSIGARLRLYGPELVFDDAVVRTPDRTRILATARRGSVGFDVWTAIRTGRLSAGRFMLDAPEIGLIRTADGRLQLVGQSALQSESVKPFGIEQLPTGRFQVEDAVVSFRDEITGRGPWSVSGVSFDLRRGSEELQLSGHASLPPALGKSMKFSATAVGALEQPEQLVSTFDVSGAELDLAGWADVFPDSWPAPETGHGSLRIAGEVRGMRLARISAGVDLTRVAAALPVWTTPLPVAMPMQQPLAGDTIVEQEIPARAAVQSAPELLTFDRFALELQARMQDDGTWRLSISNVDISKGDSPWRAHAIELEWRQQQDALKLSGKADRLVLQNLWPLLAYAPESDALAHLRALAATGVVTDASMDLERSASGPMRYSAQARLDNVGFAPIGKFPGLHGVSGTLEARDSGGRARLDSNNLQFDLPRYFRAPIEVRSFAGAFAWERQEDGWQIRSEELNIDSVDGRAQARFALSVPSDGSSPFMELTAQAQDLDARSTYKYLPAGRLSPRALAWLDRAFVSGRVESGDLVYRGRTREFPFRNDEGEFVARGVVKGMTFDYQQGWTPATELQGEVEFRNEGMAVRGVEALVGGLRVTEATASIGDFKVGDLRIKAVASGDLQHGLRFVADSPLGPKLGERFTSLQGQGAATSNVTLDLPLKQPTQREVDVETRLTNASVSLPDLAAPVTRLTGRLTVRHDGVDSADLQGQWLGGPLHVLIQPGAQADARSTEIVASGRASAEPLTTAFGFPPAVKLSGATHWRASARLVSDASAATPGQSMRNLQIDADLEDMEISLPEPLGKPLHERVPLRIDISFEGKQSLLARASLGDVRGLFRFTRPADSGWSFDRGTVRADAMTPSLPDHGGLRIEGDIRRFVLDDWLALAGMGREGKKLSDVLRAASVRVGVLEAFGYRWNELRGILQASEAGWRVDVESPTAAGQLVIPEDFTSQRRLTGQFDRLTLTRVPGRSASTSKLEPTRLPNAHVRIGSLQTETQSLGTVDAQLSRVPQGIQMDALTIANDSMQASMRGRWVQTPDGQRSTLTAQVASTDVGATLRSLGYTPFMEAKRGEAHIELTWPGGPDGRLLERSSGTVSMSVENGQLVSVEPGAGRVLGLFSLAALPRRLSLDFSDLTEKGLSFDTVHGDFELREGNAYTSNLLLRGPAAEIGLAGRTGLAARDYDQTAVVTGNLGVSLPVAGALAGGPALGAALLLFSQVFKEPLKGIARGYYRISGPWDEPTVERVDASQVKEAASSGPASRERG